MKCTIAMAFAFCSLVVAVHAQPLIGHWKFDEPEGATSALDSVPGGTNGAIGVNVTGGVPGAVGTAFAFPGGTTLDDIVDFGNAASIIDPILTRDRMSVSLWMNWTQNPVARSVALSIGLDPSVPPVPQDIQNFIDLGVTGSAPTAPAPPVFPNGRRFNTQGGVYGGVNIDGTKDEVVNTTGFNDNTGPFPGGGELVDDNTNPIPVGQGTALNDGAWHHVVMTIDANPGDVVQLFVDGVSVGMSACCPSTATQSIFDEFEGVGGRRWSDFEVGALARNETHLSPIIGSIDDIQFYQRALTPAEVSALFNDPGSVVVPEPATLALLGLGLIGLVRRGRKRRT